MKRYALNAIAAITVLLAGCGGGHSGGTLPPTTVSSPKPASHAAVQFTMHWPSKTTTSARKPKYISPATQSVIIQINPTASPSPGPVTFANISQATGNPPTSTLDINAPVGSDDFVIQLYDAQQTAGETAPNGNLVGQTEVTQTITAGQLNTINATIDGVAYGVSIAPVANQPTAETTASGFDIVGAAPVTFQVNALDADGNVIVPPGNLPATTLTPYGSGVSVNAVSGSSNQYTVQVTAPASKTSFPSVYATATDTYGDTANSIINITPVSAIYVGYGSGGVALYNSLGNALALPSGAFSGVQNAVAMAYDYDDNYVLVADAGQGKLLAFDSLGNAVSGFTAPSVSGINGVTYDSNNKTIYVTSTSGISSYTTAGAAGSASASVANAAAIAYVASDSSNNPLTELAVGIGGGTPTMGIYSEAAAQTSRFSLSGAPTSVAYVPYYTGVTRQLYDVRSGNIDGYDTNGFSNVTFADSNGPFGIAADQNTMDMYVTEQTTNTIVPYLPNLSGVDTNVTSITTPSSSGKTNPTGITVAY